MHIELSLDIDHDTKIRGTASALIQSLLYILNNANDSLFESGGEFKLVLFKVYKNSQSLFIDITDNGTGIDANIQNKIFEPYSHHKTPVPTEKGWGFMWFIRALRRCSTEK